MAQRRTPTTNKIIHDDLVWIKDKLSEIDVDLKLLKQTVIGNKEYGQKGLVEQVNEHRKYIEADKNLKLNKSILENEADVNQHIDEYRHAMLDEIVKGKRITI